MNANQEAVSEFRKGERVGPTKIYKCCFCKKRSADGLDMSPTDDGREFCNDVNACLRRKLAKRVK